MIANECRDRSRRSVRAIRDANRGPKGQSYAATSIAARHSISTQSEISPPASNEMLYLQASSRGAVARITLQRVAPSTQMAGSNVELFGTGFGPSVRLVIGEVWLTPSEFSGRWLVQIPADSSPEGAYPVRVVNPVGCQSQESVSLAVVMTGSCGLVGVEPFLLFGLFGTRRIRRLVA